MQCSDLCQRVHFAVEGTKLQGIQFLSFPGMFSGEFLSGDWAWCDPLSTFTVRPFQYGVQSFTLFGETAEGEDTCVEYSTMKKFSVQT